jgi:hypothetical protein
MGRAIMEHTTFGVHHVTKRPLAVDGQFVDVPVAAIDQLSICFTRIISMLHDA